MLRIQNSPYLQRNSGPSGDFELVGWFKSNSNAATQTLIRLVNGVDAFVYFDAGDLHVFTGSGGDTNFGPVPTEYFHLRVFRVGGTLTVKIRVRNGTTTTYTQIVADTLFGTAAFTAAHVGADGGTQLCQDAEIGFTRMWAAALASDADAYVESYKRRAVVTANLYFDCPNDKVSNYGISEAGSGGSFTSINGTPTIVNSGLVAVGTSVEQGYTGGTPDEDCVARSSGAVLATEAVARSFIISPSTNTSTQRSLAIDAHKMLEHRDEIALAGGLRAALAALPPGSLVILQGGINDTWAGSDTAANVVIYYQDLTAECRKWGVTVVWLAPTRIDASLDPSGKLSAVAAGLLSNASQCDKYADPGLSGAGVYTVGPDLLHPAPGTYGGLGLFVRAAVNDALVGVQGGPTISDFFSVGPTARPGWFSRRAVASGWFGRSRAVDFFDQRLLIADVGGTSVALTGLSVGAVVAVGTLAPSASATLPGSQAGAQALGGTLSPSASSGISGSAAGVQALGGTVSPAVAYALAGAVASAQCLAGSPLPSVSCPVTGSALAAACSAGTLTPDAGGTVVPLTGSGAAAACVGGSVAPAVSSALSGAQTAAQCQGGILAPSVSSPASGSQVSASVQAGSVASSVSSALTGAQAGAQCVVGTVAPSASVTPGGGAVGAAVAAGTLAPSASKALTGSQGSAQALGGTMVPQLGGTVLGLTGSQLGAACSVGLLAPSVSKALSGSQVAAVCSAGVLNSGIVSAYPPGPVILEILSRPAFEIEILSRPAFEIELE